MHAMSRKPRLRLLSFHTRLDDIITGEQLHFCSRWLGRLGRAFRFELGRDNGIAKGDAFGENFGDEGLKRWRCGRLVGGEEGVGGEVGEGERLQAETTLGGGVEVVGLHGMCGRL